MLLPVGLDRERAVVGECPRERGGRAVLDCGRAAGTYGHTVERAVFPTSMPAAAGRRRASPPFDGAVPHRPTGLETVLPAREDGAVAVVDWWIGGG